VAEEHIEEILDRLFDGSEEVIESFGNAFTFEQFRKKILRYNEVAYIDLLFACRNDKPPFERTHWYMGTRLRPLAEEMGYKRETKGTEINIFGDRSEKITYTRK
jgi:hypothetical protein